jgi:hypothetical protein
MKELADRFLTPPGLPIVTGSRGPKVTFLQIKIKKKKKKERKAKN